jgi:phage anti-repressor protein
MTIELSESLVLALVESDEQFSVDFDQAWQWIGYSRKDNALKKLKNNFIAGKDFSSIRRTTPQGGHPTDQYLLTTDCFKCLAMMAGTAKGKEVREYFLDCERTLKTKSQPSRIEDILNMGVAYANKRLGLVEKELPNLIALLSVLEASISADQMALVPGWRLMVSQVNETLKTLEKEFSPDRHSASLKK